ncbi:MAG: hypothetical protein IJG40_13370, partial [Oscillospiraceae bacterium]|nr:hypothetical protein [Oscillospiraceae bacterium]
MIAISVGQVLGHNLSISGTYVGLVGCLTALLELGCEYRDSDGNQHGPLMTQGIDTVKDSSTKPAGGKHARLGGKSESWVVKIAPVVETEKTGAGSLPRRSCRCYSVFG